jgi:hypothetical protein
MEKWQIILIVILALNGFWLFSMTCMLASIARHTQIQSEAITLFIATAINNTKGGNHDTTGEKDS